MNLELATTKTFVFEHKGLQVYTDGTGNLWFLAAEICDILGHTNSRVAVSALEPEEKGVTKVYTLGGEQSKTIVSEAGLYQLIFRSNLPIAKHFKKWLANEVLPAIRKTGRYEKPLSQDEYTVALANQALALVAEKQALQLQINLQKPLVSFAEAVKGSVNLHTINEVSKVIGHPCGQRKLFALLREKGWLFKRGKDNLPAQEYVKQGLFEVRYNVIPTNHGDETRPQAMVTAKGLPRVIALWNESRPKK